MKIRKILPVLFKSGIKKDQIINTIKQVLGNNDYLMIKGSNATKLSLISEKMIKGI